MNQILYSEHGNIKNNKNNNYIFLKLSLYISIFLIVLLVSYFLYSLYNKNKEEKFSKSLLNSFNLEYLYSESEEYVSVESNNNDSFFVIGIVEIPKINIKYPILSDINDTLLKMSPCRFYGPSPNKAGNMCIAAHNYDNNKFFSNLYKLDIGDIVNIYDSNNKLISYIIYNKFEVSNNDISCTSQNTFGKKEITLITCNNINNSRLIVKASELKK